MLQVRAFARLRRLVQIIDRVVTLGKGVLDLNLVIEHIGIHVFTVHFVAIDIAVFFLAEPVGTFRMLFRVRVRALVRRSLLQLIFSLHWTRCSVRDQDDWLGWRFIDEVDWCDLLHESFALGQGLLCRIRRWGKNLIHLSGSIAKRLSLVVRSIHLTVVVMMESFLEVTASAFDQFILSYRLFSLIGRSVS